MEFIPVVIKKAYLAASIYGLIHIHIRPSGRYPMFSTPAVWAATPRINRIESNLWNKLFTALAGIASTSDREVDLILNELKAISIHGWGEVGAISADIGERVSNLYRRKKDKITSYI